MTTWILLVCWSMNKNLVVHLPSLLASSTTKSNVIVWFLNGSVSFEEQYQYFLKYLKAVVNGNKQKNSNASKMVAPRKLVVVNCGIGDYARALDYYTSSDDCVGYNDDFMHEVFNVLKLKEDECYKECNFQEDVGYFEISVKTGYRLHEFMSYLITMGTLSPSEHQIIAEMEGKNKKKNCSIQ